MLQKLMLATVLIVSVLFAYKAYAGKTELNTYVPQSGGGGCYVAYGLTPAGQDCLPNFTKGASLGSYGFCYVTSNIGIIYFKEPGAVCPIGSGWASWTQEGNEAYLCCRNA